MDIHLKKSCRDLAEALADAARVETLRYFRQPGLTADNKEKDGFDPVTQGDRAAEEVMRSIIETRCPKDGILGEEFGLKASQSGLTWVLDPIDGTRAYLAGAPTWGTLIALHDGDAPVLGVIDQPYIGERFTGGWGEARLTGPLGDRHLQVSKTNALSDAIIMTTYPEVGTTKEAAGFHRVAKQCKLTRYGMDCYGYALLAGGHVDLVIEAGLQSYDIQAPIAVVEAAGGIVTNWQGGPVDQGGQAIAAATPQLHAEALRVLRGVA